MAAALPHHFRCSVPFPTARHARIACDTLAVDPEANPRTAARSVTVSDTVVSFELRAAELKVLRVVLRTFFEHLVLCVETMQRFDESLD
eukprot:m.154322 g.154322  ORF g.154322 m.154322 type:complete len:89 (+) comp17495_c0_seq4:1539-1805(+)